MRELMYLEMSIFFEIQDAEMYGGTGTKGYVEYKLGGVKKPERFTDGHIEKIVLGVAKLMGVPREKVRVIPKEEFEEATEESPDFG